MSAGTPRTQPPGHALLVLLASWRVARRAERWIMRFLPPRPWRVGVARGVMWAVSAMAGAAAPVGGRNGSGGLSLSARGQGFAVRGRGIAYPYIGGGRGGQGGWGGVGARGPGETNMRTRCFKKGNAPL